MVAAGENDVIVDLNVFGDGRANTAYLRKFFSMLARNAKLKVRVLIFTLSSGEMEILVTSLLDQILFKREIFFELYNLRWGVEEHNKHLKLIAQLENFSGKSKISIEQDFYATVLTCNIANMLAQEALDDIQDSLVNKELKYEYQINKNIALGILKDELIHVLVSGSDLQLFCREIKERMARSLVPIRKNRSFQRKKSVSRKYPPNCRKSL